jgi:hypothetical protein
VTATGVVWPDKREEAIDTITCLHKFLTYAFRIRVARRNQIKTYS